MANPNPDAEPIARAVKSSPHKGTMHSGKKPASPAIPPTVVVKRCKCDRRPRGSGSYHRPNRPDRPQPYPQNLKPSKPLGRPAVLTETPIHSEGKPVTVEHSTVPVSDNRESPESGKKPVIVEHSTVNVLDKRESPGPESGVKPINVEQSTVSVSDIREPLDFDEKSVTVEHSTATALDNRESPESEEKPVPMKKVSGSPLDIEEPVETVTSVEMRPPTESVENRLVHELETSESAPEPGASTSDIAGSTSSRGVSELEDNAKSVERTAVSDLKLKESTKPINSPESGVFDSDAVESVAATNVPELGNKIDFEKKSLVSDIKIEESKETISSSDSVGFVPGAAEPAITSVPQPEPQAESENVSDLKIEESNKRINAYESGENLEKVQDAVVSSSDIEKPVNPDPEHKFEAIKSPSMSISGVLETAKATTSKVSEDSTVEKAI